MDDRPRTNHNYMPPRRGMLRNPDGSEVPESRVIIGAIIFAAFLVGFGGWALFSMGITYTP